MMKITDAHGEISTTPNPLETQSLASAAKVERLRAAIRDGSFRIDVDKIARRLMGDDEP